jgi:hypothetical protein
MAFIPLKNFLSIRHFKLIGLIGPRAVGERVNLAFILARLTVDLEVRSLCY